MKRTLALILALLMVFTLFAACGDKKADAGTKPADGGATTPDTPATTPSTDPNAGQTTTPNDPDKSYSVSELIAMTTYPSADATLDFAFYNTFVGVSGIGQAQDAKYQIGCVFFENLFAWDDATNEPIPWLAESYEWINDTTFRVHLRDGIKSIAGDPFTASDVVWTMQFQYDTGLLASYYKIYDRDNIKAVDEKTVDIGLVQAYPFVMYDLANACFSMGCEASAKAVAYNGSEWDTTKLLWEPSFGTGPYKLVETDETTYIKTERRDDYWGFFTPYYKYINISGTPDPTTRVFGVEAGDYDATHQVTFSTAANYLNSDELLVYSVASAGNIYNLFFNSDKEPFNNLALRQAIALAIDYESIVDIAFSGLASKSDTSLLPTANGYYAPADGENDYIRYDVEAAKAKLVEAGYPNGIDLELTYGNADSAIGKIAEALQYMLQEIGVRFTLNPLEPAVFFGIARSEDFTICLSSSVLPNPKQQVNMVDPRSPHKSVTGGSGSHWYTDNDYLTALIDVCLSSTEDAKRVEAFHELGEICREYVPKVGLACPTTIVIANNKITGMHIGLDGVPAYQLCYEDAFITG